MREIIKIKPSTKRRLDLFNMSTEPDMSYDEILDKLITHYRKSKLKKEFKKSIWSIFRRKK